MELLEIGTVVHGFSDDEVRDNAGRLDGEIRIHEKYLGGTDGLEKHRYIFVVAVMHKHLHEKYPLKIKPRLLLRKGYSIDQLPEIGVFASDSPSRPNPIGITLLRVRNIKNGTVYVSGLDLFNGTPIVDIKPYSPRYNPKEESSSEQTASECDDVWK